MNKELKGVIYFEKSKLPIKIWVFIAGMSASIYLAIWAPLGDLPALLLTLIFTIGFLLLLQMMQTTIYVTKEFLYANKAKIEIKYIKSVTPLSKAEFKELNGVASDPAAFLATNFWTHTGVKVVIKDKNDPTPYWLISTNRASELAEKLN